ncbi:hypothetical protein CBS101457_006419 [Exobasidium rhododendri]|nr:hypothetical protein CBS101457_006419 [Exobasidium rhododendri]
MFAYLMILPARGVRVNYLRWQKDEHLQRVIPLLTVSIVTGFVAMVIALSPACAPSPPSTALSQRLLEAANAAGGNLQKAKSGVQVLLSDAARSLGLNSGGGSSNLPNFGSDLDVSSLLRALRLPDGEALAGKLGVSKEHTKDLLATLERYQNRAQAWKEGNVSVLGWTGALIGSASAFTLMFGIVGLFGLFTPKDPKAKSKRSTM